MAISVGGIIAELGVVLGVVAVVIAARIVGSPGVSGDGLTIIPSHGTKLPTLPVIMRTEQQEAELADQYSGKIPPVFDNLDGLGGLN